VLGSGLGPLADDVAEPVILPYAELPGFPEAGVAGHAGRLVLGRVGETPVALMQGRAHLYENGRPDGMNAAVQALAEIGCRMLVLTNAAGSLDPELAPGSVMLVSDHIGLTGVSPLFGESGTERFVDMVDAYSPRLRERLRELAARLGIELREGVYVWFSGPQFETPAEIRAAKILGGTAVGMSTVPEVILARRAGLEVAALSVITNLAARDERNAAEPRAYDARCRDRGGDGRPPRPRVPRRADLIVATLSRTPGIARRDGPGCPALDGESSDM
ncbi:MAG: purine-nucleoside phosphorylase, partial [Gaiellaceae bacterium]